MSQLMPSRINKSVFEKQYLLWMPHLRHCEEKLLTQLRPTSNLFLSFLLGVGSCLLLWIWLHNQYLGNNIALSHLALNCLSALLAGVFYGKNQKRVWTERRRDFPRPRWDQDLCLVSLLWFEIECLKTQFSTGLSYLSYFPFKKVLKQSKVENLYLSSSCYSTQPILPSRVLLVAWPHRVKIFHSVG